MTAMIVGCVAHVLALCCAVGYGETRLAEAAGLPREYSPVLFPRYKNAYLAGFIFCASVTMLCLGYK